MYPLSENLPEHIRDYLVKYTARGTISLKDENGNPILLNGKEIKISKFDFKELSGYSDEEILEIIRIDTGIDLSREPKKGLEALNSIFFQAGQFFNDSILKKVFERKGVKGVDFSGFSTIDEILAYIRAAGQEEGEWEAKLKCMVLKCCSSVNDILNTPGANNLDEKKERVVDRLRPVLSLREVGDELQGTIGGKKFILYGRPKKVESIGYKNLNDPEYSRVEDIKDNVGLTFEIIGGDQNDYVQLFLKIQLVTIALGGSIRDSKVKGVNFDDVDMGKFSESEKDMINGLRTDKKSGSSEGYVDIKFSCAIDGVKIEMKIVPFENNNQEGLRFQGIYAYLSKYIEGIMMRHLRDGFVFESDLVMFAELFFENLQSLLNENPETVGMSKEEYLEGLWIDMQKEEYNKKPLIRRDVKMKNRKYDDNIKRHFIPGLVKYFKSKLIEDKDEKGIPIWRNERTSQISEYDFEKAA